MKNPTIMQYEALDQCYDYFNSHLFGATLPAVIFTTQRKNRMLGYYSNKRWKSADGKICDEIAINPDYIAHVSYIKLMQTIVHEMVHCWQFHHGNPSRGGYHNLEWGDKMRSIGLIPSNTGKPGGKVFGQQMDDYPDPDGKFLKACMVLLNDKKYPILWTDVFGRPVSLDIENLNATKGLIEQMTGGKAKTVAEAFPEVELLHEQSKDDAAASPQLPTNQSKSKLKYTCPGCKLNMWGKPNIHVVCGTCEKALISEPGV